MTQPPSFSLRRALALPNLPFVVQQCGLALLVLVLFVLWLRVPDASVLEVLISVLLALLLVALAGMSESALILRLCGRAITRPRLVRGAIVLFLATALWFGWTALIADGRARDDLWAGYLNSRFPRSTRNLFSQPHLLALLVWLWTALSWIGTGVLASVAVSLIASTQPVRSVSRALRSPMFWIMWPLTGVLATLFTGKLMNWVPGHGLAVESLSLLFRLAVVFVADACIVSGLVATLAVFVREAEPLYTAPAGTPDNSQPRTADRP